MAEYRSKYTGGEIDSILAGAQRMIDSPVTKESLGLDKVNNTPDSEKMVAHAKYADRDSQGNIFLDHYATKEKVSTVESIAKGANQAVSFANYKIMIEFLNGLPESELTYKIGQNIMIVTLEVPDLWVSDILSVCEPYTYTSDEDFVNELKTHGYVRVGYCVLSCLETQKVNLGEYTKKEDIGDINALKRITYYGDADIFPSSDDLFYYDLNSDGKSYNVSPMNPNNLGTMVIPYEYNGLPVTKVCGFNGTDISEITLPKSIVEIADNTFSDCSDLIKVVIPDSVTKIGGSAFYNCHRLKEITIPDSVKQIGFTAFALCSSLQTVVIGNGIENVGMDIFYSCGALDVYFSGAEDEWKFNTEYEMTDMTIHYDWTPAMKSELPTKESLGLDRVDNTPDNVKHVCSADEADTAYIAFADENGNNIKKTYATKEEVQRIVDGYTTVGWADNANHADRALFDENGREIHLTYATKEEVGEIETALDNIIVIQEALILPDAEEVEF